VVGRGRAVAAAAGPDSNLVETVKGFTKEESTVFGDIANAARNVECAGPAGKIEANGKLDSALGRLLLLTENYPQLRSSDQFMRLQDELAGTEIASAWRASGITIPCATTTPSCANFQQHLGRHRRIQREQRLLRGQPQRETAPASSSKEPARHCGALTHLFSENPSILRERICDHHSFPDFCGLIGDFEVVFSLRRHLGRRWRGEMQCPCRPASPPFHRVPHGHSAPRCGWLAGSMAYRFRLGKP